MAVAPPDTNTNSGSGFWSTIGGFVDPVFSLFGGITAQRTAEQQAEAQLLLASQPKRNVANRNAELYLFLGMLAVLAMVIIVKLFL